MSLYDEYEKARVLASQQASALEQTTREQMKEWGLLGYQAKTYYEQSGCDEYFDRIADDDRRQHYFDIALAHPLIVPLTKIWAYWGELNRGGTVTGVALKRGLHPTNRDYQVFGMPELGFVNDKLAFGRGIVYDRRDLDPLTRRAGGVHTKRILAVVCSDATMYICSEHIQTLGHVDWQNANVLRQAFERALQTPLVRDVAPLADLDFSK